MTNIFQANAYNANNRLPLGHIPTEFLSTSSPSSSVVPTDTPRSIPPSIKLEVNYTHHHHISLKSEASSKAGSTDIEKIIDLIASNSPRKLQPSSQIGRNYVSQYTSPSKSKMIMINNYPMQYHTKTLPDPLTLFSR